MFLSELSSCELENTIGQIVFAHHHQSFDSMFSFFYSHYDKFSLNLNAAMLNAVCG